MQVEVLTEPAIPRDNAIVIVNLLAEELVLFKSESDSDILYLDVAETPLEIVPVHNPITSGYPPKV